MAKDPAFLFYPEKFINGTLFMTDEQTGKYIKLLCHQHQNGGMISKEDFENFVGADKKVRSKFVETNDGFFNERMMVEIEKRKKKSNNLSANAKKRWDEYKQKQCKSNAIAYGLHMPTKDKDTNTNKDVINNVDNKKKVFAKNLYDEYQKRNKKLIKVKVFTKERKQKCNARLINPSFLDQFIEAVDKAQDSPFLCGEKGGWRADFDWFIANDTNVVKVLEGKYSDREPEKPLGLDEIKEKIERGEL